jgi:hypothetical protein
LMGGRAFSISSRQWLQQTQRYSRLLQGTRILPREPTLHPLGHGCSARHPIRTQRVLEHYRWARLDAMIGPPAKPSSVAPSNIRWIGAV